MAWENRNIGYSFTETFGPSLKALSAVSCSEVTVFNFGPAALRVYDNNRSADSQSLLVPVSADVIIRGVTSSDAVSAKFTAGSGPVSYRTQYYSLGPII